MKTNIKKLTQKGFSHFELALVIIIVAAISAVGFYVYSAKNNKSKADSMTSVTNKLVHGSYVTIESCLQNGRYASSTYVSGNYIVTNVMLTDEKYFDTNTNKPMIVADNKTSSGIYPAAPATAAPGLYTGRAKPESYKVIVGAIKSGKKASTQKDRWRAAYKYTNNHGRIQKVVVGPIENFNPSVGPNSTVRYYIMFHNQLVYTKDVPLNTLSYCNPPQI